MEKGFISAVCRSPAKGMQKTDIGEAILVEGMGMEGDGHFGFEHRQVSLLSAEESEKMRQKVPDIKPGAFAENLLVRNFDLTSLKIGDRFHVGPTLLEVTQIGKECHDRCAIYRAAGDCIMPRLGIFCSVIIGGKIKIGDIVYV
ncbi:MAG: MOSC domain-containing protein [Synergistaceae bacterium]|nr:MOSC domain-containing protein [Synergistaceae bacterium]